MMKDPIVEEVRAARKKLTYKEGDTIIRIPYRPAIKLIFHTWNLYRSKQNVKNLEIPIELEVPYDTK